MIQTIVLLAVALAGTAAVAYLLRGSLEQPANLIELLERMQPVNAGSFRHLAGGSDDWILRSTLPLSQYRRLRRLRLRAIVAYYLCAFRNSGLLISYGTFLLKSETEELRLFGEQLSTAAIRLRFALLSGMVGALACYLAPVALLFWRQVPDMYSQIGSHLYSYCEANAPDLQLAVAQHFSL